ncbi:MAG: bifunctional DNA primase/polymerase [Rubrivivax sp.]|nr:bifunctional DNA primase/polymerase [Pyrinomonadaceae bacterium]
MSARDFANVTDMTSLILREIGFPLRRRRSIVCALQGVAGDRLEFQCSHLVLARRLEHKGKDLAAEMAAYRELCGLREFQRRSGYTLFVITRGGGIEHRRTAYEDKITPVAMWAVGEARRSDLWRANPGKALEAMVEAAVDRLPYRKPYFSLKEHIRAGSSGGDKAVALNTEAEITRRRDSAMKNAATCFKLLADSSNAGTTLRFAESLAADIMEKARSFVDEILAGADAGALAESSGTFTSPLPIHIHSSARGASGDETDGLHICSPPPPAVAGDERQAELLSAALGYAQRGWSVLPLYAVTVDGRCTCRQGAACDSAGKHPRVAKGVRDATTGAAQIADWWQRHPDANIGLAMGAASGIVCLDVDPRNGGDASLAELTEQHGDLPDTAAVATGGGGFHLFFKHPQAQFKNSSSKIAPGLDVKTGGGYVVAAPSRHASGKTYVWQSDAPPADLPPWLLDLLSKGVTVERPSAKRAQAKCPGDARRDGAVARAQATAGGTIGDGSRNNELFRIACAMRGRGAETDEIESELDRVNRLKCAPPLPSEEVTKLARSAARYAPDSR